MGDTDRKYVGHHHVVPTFIKPYHQETTLDAYHQETTPDAYHQETTLDAACFFAKIHGQDLVPRLAHDIIRCHSLLQ